MKNLVIAITPNPALDLSGTVDKIKLDEKTYVRDEILAPGGNAINAARILSRLKSPVLATGFIGGSVGEEVLSLLRAEDIQTRFVEIQSRTRINVTVSTARDHCQTRLSFPGPKIRLQEKRKLFELVRRQRHVSSLLLGGSLPDGFTAKDIVHLLQLSRKKKVPSFVDCPGAILAQIVSAGPTLIKPNLEEFQELTNSRVATVGSVIEKSKKILRHVQNICVSSVEGGALLITQNGIFFGRIPKVKIMSTVGAGDSMVGAIAAHLSNGGLFNAEGLAWGLAAAAATLSHPGTRLGSAEEILRLRQRVQIETIVAGRSIVTK